MGNGGRNCDEISVDLQQMRLSEEELIDIPFKILIKKLRVVSNFPFKGTVA
jgi:hypothetical protein